MNEQAQKHLDVAEKHIAKGDSFYRQAAEEIIAAQEADPTLGNREIGKRFNRSEWWVRTIVAHATSARPDSEIDWKRGSHATTAEVEKAVIKTLADPKKRAKAIDALPAVEQAKIATDLTAKVEVREEILKAGPMAVDQHYKVTDEAIKRRIKKQEHEVKKERPVVAGKTAADYIGEAAELLTRALQEVNEYGVEMKHDRLGRISSGLKRVKRYTKEIEAALDVEIEDEDTTTDDLYIA